MSESINLLQNVYNKQQYKNTVNVEFADAAETIVPTAPLPTVVEFFEYYNRLFFDIPKTGIRSHTTLIDRSTSYVGNEKQSAEINALVQEINGLRETILQQQETILQLTATNE